MSHIKTFARLKPTQELYEDFEISKKKTFSLRVPELLRDFGVQSVKNRIPTISYDFQYDRVFETSASQEEVYNVAAKDIVAGFLDGYNGTIFAYGQTGTGKTYTVEGSPRRYSDRGLAPRALTEIYKCLEGREGEDITLSISYLEIYQEVAYDLLSTTARTTSPVTVFPRVTVVEGANGTCMIRNLSVHLAPSEDVASTLLLQGQANRKVAETPVNLRSSRSHAVFTIYLAAKKHGSDIITRSKLHLVDLAGSERVAKTGVEGQQLTEAKCINLSLHYLETVIITLQAETSQTRPRSTGSSNNKGNTSLGGRPISSEGGRRHVPYRNSLLTMVLRDSLGGNCQTSMIATISLEIHNLGETLSTCRFAQRVACIANCARRNEEIDDKTLIQQLKRRVAELETQMACLRLSLQTGGGEGRSEDQREEDETTSKLTDEDKLACAQVVQEYLAGRVTDPLTAGITNPFKFRECLQILKRMVMTKYFQDKLPANQLPVGMERTNQGPVVNDNARVNGMTETQGTIETLRLEDTGDSAASPPGQPAESGVMDPDDMILNIQRLYAATRREQKSSQQTAPEPSGSSPKPGMARTDSYKSPYERKREKEIRKLSRKLETMKKTQSAKDQQLQELRTTTAFTELSSTEAIIRNKISVTREQIADQHAYRLHLRHTEAAPDILQQEKLVEDQLIKREAKFQRKLDEVLQKKADLEAQVTQGEGSEVKDEKEGQGQTKSAGGKKALEEQFSQYKKRNGTLNTRQVFDMLKSEEKKQTKATHHSETEKKLLLTKQLAVKEEATREKLRELKEMMRKSREEAMLDQPNPPPGMFGAFNGGFFPPNPFMSAWGDIEPPPTDTDVQGLNQTHTVDKYHEKSMPHSFNQTYTADKRYENPAGLKFGDLESNVVPAGSEKHGSRSNGGKPAGNNKTVGNSSKLSDSKIVDSNSKTVVNSSSHIIQNHSSSNPPSHDAPSVDQKWESVYSRPSTAHSTRSQDWADPIQRDNKPTLSHNSHSGGGSVNNASSSSDPLRDRTNGRVNGNTSDLPTHKNSDFYPNSQENKQVRGAGTDRNNKNGVSKNRDWCAPTLMPSEYVHSKDSREHFDGRKMGLSSKTFDSALSSMLNDDSKPVAYGFEHYDKFARESKPPIRKARPSHSPERRGGVTATHRSPERRTPAATDVSKDLSGTSRTAWGPEAKNFSVAKRLNQFLTEDKTSKPPRPTDPASPNKPARSVSFLERLNQLQGEDSTPDLEVTSPRIQALQDTQREVTYMGRIQAEKERVAKIRQAREAAEAIQRAWRRHLKLSK